MEAPVPSVEVLAPPAVTSPAHKPILTPPTSEEWNKAEDNSSELSDLDLADLDDIGEIEPDHYYEDGKIPVFKPTMDQFRSFKKFIDKIDKYGMKSGIVKVIPPAEWRDSLPALDEAVKTIKVKNPITQEFAGTHGTYTQANIEKQRSYNLPQWKALTEESNHQPPARRGERRRNQDKVVRGANPRPKPASQPATSATTTPVKRGRGRPRKKGNAAPPPAPSVESPAIPAHESDDEDSQLQVPPTPTSPDDLPTDNDPDQHDDSPTKKVVVAKGRGKKSQPSTPRAKGSQPKSVSERRKYNQAEVTDLVDESAFKDFNYRLENLEDYTAERCAELETAYWRSMTFAPPMYGADMPGSLFDDSTTSWNVARLENLLDVLGCKVPGVNTAYLYLGMWKATFAWHLEDVDLYSINYIHFGAPKQWYSISQEDARRFESAMRTIWPNDAKNCSQFLRHKTYLISPALLQSQFNIKVNKLVHHEGEFVITFPYGYHSGYNLGYNCAESVNFATEAWLDYGRIAKKCNCEADSVWVDVGEIERKLRGEPTPEYYEETDDDDLEGEFAGDLPSPPSSVKGKGRKRKRDSIIAKGPMRKVKKIKIRIRSAHAEPCVLCPNDVPFEKILPTDNGKKAHEVCALYTPELYIWDQDGPERVCDVDKINKARFGLKCHYCRSKKGSCFQCSARKCTRAYHATCAAAAGVQVEYGPTPWYGADGIEYKTEDYDFRCRWHRPKRPKHTDVDTLEKNALVRRRAAAVMVNEVVQVQYVQGDIFAGLVIENRVSERTLLIDVLPDGDRMEVDWKYLLTLDPADSQMIKPSADAQDLPQDFDKQKIRTEPQNGPPMPDDVFNDPDAVHKWAEFNTAPAPHNKVQAKVDLDKSNQLWHYLGITSTEAKAQFTEDVANPRHNVAGNFLDTVKPAPAIQPVVQKRAAAPSYQFQYPPQFSHSHAPSGPSHSSPSSLPAAIPPSSLHTPWKAHRDTMWPSSMLSQHNAAAGPAAPVAPEAAAAAAAAAPGKSTGVDLAYLEHISQYSYLKNAYLRKPATYESPYPGTEGFSSTYERKFQAAQSVAVTSSASTSGNDASSTITSHKGYYQLVPQPEQAISWLDGPKEPRPPRGTYQTPEQFQEQMRAQASAGHANPAISGFEHLRDQLHARVHSVVAPEVPQRLDALSTAQEGTGVQCPP